MIQKDTYLMIHFIANKSSILEDRADIEKFTNSTKTAKSTAALRQTLTEKQTSHCLAVFCHPILVGRFKF